MGLVLYKDPGDSIARQTCSLFDTDTPSGPGQHGFYSSPGILDYPSSECKPRPAAPRLSPASCTPTRSARRSSSRSTHPSRRTGPVPCLPSFARQDAFCADRSAASDEQQLRRLGIVCDGAAAAVECASQYSSQFTSQSSSQVFQSSQSSCASWTDASTQGSLVASAPPLDHRHPIPDGCDWTA